MKTLENKAESAGMPTKPPTLLATAIQERNASSYSTPQSSLSTWKGIRHHKDYTDYIYVPVGQRSAPLPAMPVISTRLSHVLAYMGLKIFGDLHGRRLADIRNYRSCGKQTILELEALLKGVQGGVMSLELLQRGGAVTSAELLQRGGAVDLAAPPVRHFFSVAPAARDLHPLDLPLSLRAEKALKRLGVRRLGDLERVTVYEIKRLENCAGRTIREIQTLLQRAGTGEFSMKPEALRKAIPCDLLAQIDGILSHLPKRELEIVTLRLGASGQPSATLACIGGQFHISRERVRQIVRGALGKLIRLGGPKTEALLNAIAATCHSNVCPLKVDRAPKPCPLRYTPEFYVRAHALARPDSRSSKPRNPLSWPPV